MRGQVTAARDKDSVPDNTDLTCMSLVNILYGMTASGGGGDSGGGGGGDSSSGDGGE